MQIRHVTKKRICVGGSTNRCLNKLIGVGRSGTDGKGGGTVTYDDCGGRWLTEENALSLDPLRFVQHRRCLEE